MDTITLSVKETLKMIRSSRRKAKIDLKVPLLYNKVHKSKKTYNRNKNKKITLY